MTYKVIFKQYTIPTINRVKCLKAQLVVVCFDLLYILHISFHPFLKFLALLKVTFRLQSINDVRNVRFVVKDFHQLVLRLIDAVRDNLAALYVALETN